MQHTSTDSDGRLPENKTKLTDLIPDGDSGDFEVMKSALKDDLVVRVKNIAPEKADELVFDVCKSYGLHESLKLQSGYATIHGHRGNIGKYFMTVNERSDYQVIPPHSESTRFADMQLTIFYCRENSVKGGETILFNVDSDSDCWNKLKERGARIKHGNKQMSDGELAKARAMLSIDPLKDLLSPKDIILKEHGIPNSDAKIYDVLTAPRKSYSKLLEKEVFTYWSNIAGIDYDSMEEYIKLLKESGLFCHPPTELSIAQLDPVRAKRAFSSEVKFTEIFSSKLTLDLEPGDLVVLNNLSWAHSTNNFEPGSGTRDIAVAFA